MDLIISKKFEKGNKALFPHTSGGKTYLLLVKIDDVTKVEKTAEDTYKIFYTAFVYDNSVDPDSPTTDAEKYKTMTVEEAKLITMDEFQTNIVAKF